MAIDNSGGATLHQDTAEMQRAVGHIDSTSSQISGVMHQISNSVADASAWQGETSTTFVQSMTQWNQAATKMNRVLQEIQEGIHGSDVSVNSQESDSAAAMQRAGGGLTFGMSPA